MSFDVNGPCPNPVGAFTRSAHPKYVSLFVLWYSRLMLVGLRGFCAGTSTDLPLDLHTSAFLQ